MKRLLSLLVLVPLLAFAEDQGVRYSAGNVTLGHGTGNVALQTDADKNIEFITNNVLRGRISSNGVLFNGRLMQSLTATDVDAQNNTLTVAQIAAGLIIHTSVTGGGTVTTDTAANIIAGSSGANVLSVNGQCLQVYYINDGTQTLTFAGGTSVTVADTGQTVAADEAALLLFCRASSTTVTLYVLGA